MIMRLLMRKTVLSVLVRLTIQNARRPIYAFLVITCVMETMTVEMEVMRAQFSVPLRFATAVNSAARMGAVFLVLGVVMDIMIALMA